MSKVQVTETLTRQENKENWDMMSRKDKEIDEMRRELEDTRKKLDEVVMQRKSEGTALLEIDHYKADNERLIAMLSKTEEFKNFG
jgi:hypothetical protein